MIDVMIILFLVGAAILVIDFLRWLASRVSGEKS